MFSRPVKEVWWKHLKFCNSIFARDWNQFCKKKNLLLPPAGNLWSMILKDAGRINQITVKLFNFTAGIIFRFWSIFLHLCVCLCVCVNFVINYGYLHYMHFSKSREKEPEEHIFLTSDCLTTALKEVRDYHISILSFPTKAIQLSPRSAIKIWNPVVLADLSAGYSQFKHCGGR